jgi:hypothetical protein
MGSAKEGEGHPRTERMEGGTSRYCERRQGSEGHSPTGTWREGQVRRTKERASDGHSLPGDRRETSQDSK